MKVERAKNPKVAFALVGIILLALFAFQIGRASQIATTNYHLETPLPLYDYYIGQYSNNTYFAINGSNWDNFWVSSNVSLIANNIMGNLTDGGTIYWGVGDFAVSPQIYVANNTRMVGAGDTTRLYLPAGQPSVASQHRIIYISNCENVTIENFCIDGDYLNNDVTGLTYPGLVYVANSRHVTIKDCLIKNARIYGVVVYSFSGSSGDVYDVNVFNCRVIECKWNGITYYHSTSSSYAAPHHCIVENCYVYGSCDVGLDTFMGGTTNTPHNIIFKDNTVIGDGVSGYGSTTDVWYPIRIEAGQGIEVVGNTVYNGKGSNTLGICDSVVYDVGRLLIAENICYNASYAGIRIHAANHSQIVNNIIETSGRGIDIESHYNLISGNTISSTYYGIVETASASSNIYALNDLVDCTNAASFGGSNSTVTVNNGYP